MKKILIIIMALSATASFGNTQKRIAALEEMVEELQYKNYERYYSLSGSLINHYESFQAETHSTEEETTRGSQIDTLSTVLSLNINFDVSPRLKVYTKLGMSKFWNTDSGGQVASGNRNEPYDAWQSSLTGSYGYWGSTPRFDRAYMAYTLENVPLTLAVGRLPTNQGPPTEKMDGADRKGTYPRFAYNAIYDGMGIAYNARNWLPKGHNINLRLFFSPYINVGANDRLAKRDQPGDDTFDRKFKSLTPQFTAQLEYENTNQSWAEKVHLMAFGNSYSSFQEIEDGEDDPENVGYDAKIAMGYVSLEGLFGTGLSLNGSMVRVYTEYDYEGEMSIYNSTAYLFNATYLFSNSFNGGHTIGIEYIKTDYNYYLDEFNYFYLSDFYSATNNKGFHVSYNIPLNANVKLRAGVFSYKDEVALYEVTSRKVTSYYTTLTTDF